MPEPRTFIGKRIMVYGSIAGAIAAIVTGFTIVAESQYRPALLGEVVEVADSVQENRAAILIIKKNGLQNSIWSAVGS